MSEIRAFRCAAVDIGGQFGVRIGAREGSDVPGKPKVGT